MRRSAKISLWTVGSFVAAILIVNGVYYLANYKKIRQEAADLQSCKAHFAKLQHDLPPGTPRDQVLRYLKASGNREGAEIGPTDEIYVPLGRVQSCGWPCSHFDYDAELSFTFGASPGLPRRLAHITMNTTGQCV